MKSLVAGLAGLTLGAVALVARYLPIPNHTMTYVVILSPVLALAAPVAVVISIWGRRWRLAAIAVVLTAALIAVQAPWYVATPPPASAMPVRVMTINMLFGEADTSAIARIAADSADVVLVQELTPDAARRLQAAGIDATFPHQAIEPRAKASGTGIYSRYPLTDRRIVPGFELAVVTAALRIDGASAPLRIAAIHTAAPWPQPIDGWRSDFAALATLFPDLARAAGSAPVIVGGDFNATIDMRPFRDLLTNGYRDSAEQAGAGRQFTFPADTSYPPLIGIDHIVTRNATATSTTGIEVAKSDHRGLLATVMVPKS